MKSIRNFFRKLKYRSKFLGKKREDYYYYISRGNVDNKLTELMNTYGSDKGGRSNHHNFSNYYSELFFHRKNLIKNFLEVGLGTNDTNVLSNMGLFQCNDLLQDQEKMEENSILYLQQQELLMYQYSSC